MGATFTKGYEFGATEEVTASKLHQLIEDAAISGITGSEIDSQTITNSNISDVSGAKFTGLANIPAGAGAIPAANMPATYATETYVKDNTEERYIYFFVPLDTLTTGTDKTGRVYLEFAGTITEAYAAVSTAPVGANLICDINYDGSTIWSTQANRVTITAGSNTGSQTSFNTTAVASGHYLTLDVDQVGSSTAGAKLVVRLTIERTYS